MCERERGEGCGGACALLFVPDKDAVKAAAGLVGDVWEVVVQSNAAVAGSCF